MDRTIFDIVMISFSGTSMFVLFLCALAFCYSKFSKDNRKRVVLLGVMLLVFIFNNFSYRLLASVVSTGTFFRFLWMLPIILMLSYVIVNMISSEKKLFRKLCIIFFVAVIASFSRGNNNTNIRSVFTSVEIPTNIYTIPEDVIQASWLIKDDSTRLGIYETVVVADMEIMPYFRGYNGRIIWGIEMWYYNNERQGNPIRDTESGMIFNAIQKGYFGDIYLLKEALFYRGIDYLVVKTELEMNHIFEYVGFRVIGETSNRSVYARIE